MYDGLRLPRARKPSVSMFGTHWAVLGLLRVRLRCPTTEGREQARAGTAAIAARALGVGLKSWGQTRGAVPFIIFCHHRKSSQMGWNWRLGMGTIYLETHWRDWDLPLQPAWGPPRPAAAWAGLEDGWPDSSSSLLHTQAANIFQHFNKHELSIHISLNDTLNAVSPFLWPVGPWNKGDVVTCCKTWNLIYFPKPTSYQNKRVTLDDILNVLHVMQITFFGGKDGSRRVEPHL